MKPQKQIDLSCIETFIGIDPGVNNGFAIYSKNTRSLLMLKTFSFWELMDFIRTQNVCNTDKVCFIVEDPQQNSSLYDKRNDKQGAVRDKVAQNIGSNKRTAQLIFEKLEMIGANYIARKPTKRSGTKMNEQAFKNLTKWDGKSSEHSRDAAMLVYGY